MFQLGITQFLSLLGLMPEVLLLPVSPNSSQV
jgi:hypothetical protein